MSQNRKQVELDTPTPELVQKYIQQFENDDRYYLADQAITKLFNLIPSNENLEDILLKLCVINNLYSTQIYATVQMARHIQKLRIDPELSNRSMEIVNRIAHFSVSGKQMYCFSFATKYCNWHYQEDYPIIDSFVSQLIVGYQIQDGFAEFPRSALRDYPKYKKILEQFRNYYGLKEFGFKKLDKFLWLYGNEKFRNKNSLSSEHI